MATATRSEQVKEVVKFESIPVFVLTLSAHEAAVLRKVCGNIGGERFGPRRVTDEINRALENAGAQYADLNVGTGSPRVHTALFIS